MFRGQGNLVNKDVITKSPYWFQEHWYLEAEKPTTAETVTTADDPAAADSSKQAEASSTGESGPILSPSSLKNPRMRKFSMGVDQSEEEIIEEDAEDEYFVKYKN